MKTSNDIEIRKWHRFFSHQLSTETLRAPSSQLCVLISPFEKSDLKICEVHYQGGYFLCLYLSLKSPHFLILHYCFPMFPFSSDCCLFFLTTSPSALILTQHFVSPFTFRVHFCALPIVLRSHFDNVSAFICLMGSTVEFIIFGELRDTAGGF